MSQPREDKTTILLMANEIAWKGQGAPAIPRGLPEMERHYRYNHHTTGKWQPDLVPIDQIPLTGNQDASEEL